MGIQDELWKDVIESLFPQFLHFFALDLAQDVDWDKGYEFLDKELHQIVPKSAESARYVDRLIKVFLKAGEERWVLVHVEVQGYWDEISKIAKISKISKIGVLHSWQSLKFWQFRQWG